METLNACIKGNMVKALIGINALLLVAIVALKNAPKENSDPAPRATVPRVQPAAAVDPQALRARLQLHARSGLSYARKNRLSTNVAFLIDMSRHSGSKRFFIYDLGADSLLASGLVAHGSCNQDFLEDAVFSRIPDCGCSAIGRYKVGYSYAGQFGTAFKLHGLDSSNRTAFERFIVLHAYDCVPDREIAPEYLCNSRGCPMVSPEFLKTASAYIRREKKPILLWIYN
ncbi:MAG: peptidase [Chitinophagaceae bacterium]|nr:MAG: peptidase [Chitinophagaceae bacterium]